MKKNLFLIATVVLVFCACERHPAGQLPTEAAGGANEQSGKATGNEQKQATPAASPSGTPKTYFPQNS